MGLSREHSVAPAGYLAWDLKGIVVHRCECRDWLHLLKIGLVYGDIHIVKPACSWIRCQNLMCRVLYGKHAWKGTVGYLLCCCILEVWRTAAKIYRNSHEALGRMFVILFNTCGFWRDSIGSRCEAGD